MKEENEKQNSCRIELNTIVARTAQAPGLTDITEVERKTKC